ncbi:Uncharacterised protein g10258 [Pycnogonum litorale]
MEEKSFTATANVLSCHDWWMYIECTELQYIPAIITTNNFYIDGTPANLMTGKLSSLVQPGDLIYVNVCCDMKNDKIVNGTVVLAWQHKKPRKVPNAVRNRCLHNQLALYTIKQHWQDQFMKTILNGIGEIEVDDEGKHIISVEWNNNDPIVLEEEELVFKRGDNVSFHAVEAQDGKFHAVKVWNENAAYESTELGSLEMVSTELPTLNYQTKKSEMNFKLKLVERKNEPVEDAETGNAENVVASSIEKLTI